MDIDKQKASGNIPPASAAKTRSASTTFCFLKSLQIMTMTSKKVIMPAAADN